MSVKENKNAAATETVSLPLGETVTASGGFAADRLEDVVEARAGVIDAEVDPSTGVLNVIYDPAAVSGGALVEEARRAQDRMLETYGFRVYRVKGMDCAHCAEGLETMARQLPGVVSATVQFSSAKMRVEFERSDTSGIELLPRRAQSMGFAVSAGEAPVGSAQAGSGPEATAEAVPEWRERLAGNGPRAAASIGLLAIGLLLEHVAHAPVWAVNTAYGLSLLAGGYRFVTTGIAALRQRIIGTNLLMAVAAAGALAIGHWEEAAMVISLYAVGVALEGAAMERTRRSLRSLIDARPAEAVVQRPDLRQETVPADRVNVGDVLVVKPGAKIATDGVVISGTSAVTEAAITGESVPADKKRGSEVYAGSVNGHGSLLVRVTAPASDSTLARLLHLVEEAQAQKAPTQALVEKFGRVYTPMVLVAALLIAVGGPLLSPGGNWLYRALTLLVVACPCALVIATPVAYVSAIARAAKAGVLVKGGAYLEGLAASRRFFFDKTGTLTTGELRVSDVATAEGVTENDLLTVAAAVERHSEHPIARAVVLAADRHGLPVREALDAAAVPGRGIMARVDGAEVYVGNAAFFAERNIAVPEALLAKERELATAGKTTLLVAEGGEVRGVVAVADAVRTDAAAMVAALHKSGRRVAMLTGDNAAVARTVGQAVGVSDCHAALLPQDKLAIVREAARTDRVAFIGDGINDAPALAAATVGIAMGAGGTAAALEAADLALMRNDLTLLPWAVRLAEATQRVVRVNVAISVGAVLILLGATLFGALPLPVGVLGHEGSALLVILNGVRLLSPRTTPRPA